MARNFSLSQFGAGSSTGFSMPGTKSGSLGPRSLNISIRKQENERIERENQAFAKKLFDNSGHISKRKLDQDYFAQTQYRKNITKVKIKKSSRRNWPQADSMFAKSNALPPISLSSVKNGGLTHRSQTQIQDQQDYADYEKQVLAAHLTALNSHQ